MNAKWKQKKERKDSNFVRNSKLSANVTRENLRLPLLNTDHSRRIPSTSNRLAPRRPERLRGPSAYEVRAPTRPERLRGPSASPPRRLARGIGPALGSRPRAREHIAILY
ncbi:hypothetical protein ACJJTC_009289 [Scirpophaga incertulas]